MWTVGNFFSKGAGDSSRRRFRLFLIESLQRSLCPTADTLPLELPPLAGPNSTTAEEWDSRVTVSLRSRSLDIRDVKVNADHVNRRLEGSGVELITGSHLGHLIWRVPWSLEIRDSVFVFQLTPRFCENDHRQNWDIDQSTNLSLEHLGGKEIVEPIWRVLHSIVERLDVKLENITIFVVVPNRTGGFSAIRIFLSQGQIAGDWAEGRAAVGGWAGRSSLTDVTVAVLRYASSISWILENWRNATGEVVARLIGPVEITGAITPDPKISWKINFAKIRFILGLSQMSLLLSVLTRFREVQVAPRSAMSAPERPSLSSSDLGNDEDDEEPTSILSRLREFGNLEDDDEDKNENNFIWEFPKMSRRTTIELKIDKLEFFKILSTDYHPREVCIQDADGSIVSQHILGFWDSPFARTTIENLEFTAALAGSLSNNWNLKVGSFVCSLGQPTSPNSECSIPNLDGDLSLRLIVDHPVELPFVMSEEDEATNILEVGAGMYIAMDESKLTCQLCKWDFQIDWNVVAAVELIIKHGNLPELSAWFRDSNATVVDFSCFVASIECPKFSVVWDLDLSKTEKILFCLSSSVIRVDDGDFSFSSDLMVRLVGDGVGSSLAAGGARIFLSQIGTTQDAIVDDEFRAIRGFEVAVQVPEVKIDLGHMRVLSIASTELGRLACLGWGELPAAAVPMEVVDLVGMGTNEEFVCSENLSIPPSRPRTRYRLSIDSMQISLLTTAPVVAFSFQSIVVCPTRLTIDTMEVGAGVLIFHKINSNALSSMFTLTSRVVCISDCVLVVGSPLLNAIDQIVEWTTDRQGVPPMPTTVERSSLVVSPLEVGESSAGNHQICDVDISLPQPVSRCIPSQSFFSGLSIDVRSSAAVICQSGGCLGTRPVTEGGWVLAIVLERLRLVNDEPKFEVSLEALDLLIHDEALHIVDRWDERVPLANGNVPLVAGNVPMSAATSFLRFLPSDGGQLVDNLLDLGFVTLVELRDGRLSTSVSQIEVDLNMFRATLVPDSINCALRAQSDVWDLGRRLSRVWKQKNDELFGMHSEADELLVGAVAALKDSSTTPATSGLHEGYIPTLKMSQPTILGKLNSIKIQILRGSHFPDSKGRIWQKGLFEFRGDHLQVTHEARSPARNNCAALQISSKTTFTLQNVVLLDRVSGSHYESLLRRWLDSQTCAPIIFAALVRQRYSPQLYASLGPVDVQSLKLPPSRQFVTPTTKWDTNLPTPLAAAGRLGHAVISRAIDGSACLRRAGAEVFGSSTSQTSPAVVSPPVTIDPSRVQTSAWWRTGDPSPSSSNDSVNEVPLRFSLAIRLRPLWISIDHKTLDAIDDFAGQLSFAHCVERREPMASQSCPTLDKLSPASSSTSSAVVVTTDEPVESKEFGSEASSDTKGRNRNFVLHSFSLSALLVRFDFAPHSPLQSAASLLRRRRSSDSQGTTSIRDSIELISTVWGVLGSEQGELIKGLNLTLSPVKLSGGTWTLNKIYSRVLTIWIRDFDRSQLLRSLVSGSTSASVRVLYGLGEGVADVVESLARTKRDLLCDLHSLQPEDDEDEARELTHWVSSGAAAILIARNLSLLSYRLSQGALKIAKMLAGEGMNASERFLRAAVSALAAVDRRVTPGALGPYPTSTFCHSSPSEDQIRAIDDIDTDDIGTSSEWNWVEFGTSGFYQPATWTQGLGQSFKCVRRGVRSAYGAMRHLDLNPNFVGGNFNADLGDSLRVLLPVLIVRPILGVVEALGSAVQGARNGLDANGHRNRMERLKGPSIGNNKLQRKL